MHYNDGAADHMVERFQALLFIENALPVVNERKIDWKDITSKVEKKFVHCQFEETKKRQQEKLCNTKTRHVPKPLNKKTSCREQRNSGKR